jgi:hypothetical protein
MNAPPRSWPALARDALCVAGLAVLTVQALRRWVGDRYLVPTGSMEPVLHGDPVRGDVVFVDKLATAAARRRHDLVVVQPPGEAQPRVKRIAACGDDPDACYVEPRDGDVWLGPDPQRMRREQKDPLDARGQRVPWARATGNVAPIGPLDLAELRLDVSGRDRLVAAVGHSDAARRLMASDVRAARRAARERSLPPGFVGSARAVDARFVDATGTLRSVGADFEVSDAGMEIVFDDLHGVLLATVETRHEALTFVWWAGDDVVVLWRDGVDVASTPWPARAASRVEFGLLDDRVFFCADGERERLWTVPRDPAWNRENAGGPRTLVHAGVAGGVSRHGTAVGDARVTVRSVQVFHDVLAYRDKITGLPGQSNSWPRFVPPGHWFLLGDSPFDSHDSRQFGPVPASSFLGVPRFVLGPWPRHRWLRP